MMLIRHLLFCKTLKVILEGLGGPFSQHLLVQCKFWNSVITWNSAYWAFSILQSSKRGQFDHFGQPFWSKFSQNFEIPRSQVYMHMALFWVRYGFIPAQVTKSRPKIFSYSLIFKHVFLTCFWRFTDNYWSTKPQSAVWFYPGIDLTMVNLRMSVRNILLSGPLQSCKVWWKINHHTETWQREWPRPWDSMNPRSGPTARDWWPRYKCTLYMYVVKQYSMMIINRTTW
jgi:hypothetical protein